MYSIVKLKNYYTDNFKKIFWPIENSELKKFLPMAGIMFCILLNYATLRSIKDGFVVTTIGTEAISFLKTYVVLPFAVLSMIFYVKLSEMLSYKTVFYVITSLFLLYIIIFAIFLYPNPDAIHLNESTIILLSERFPNFQWFIKIFGKWSFASFYTVSELWGSIMLSLLFWQFANQITKTNEAKRFYSMFGVIANLSLPIAGYIISYCLTRKIPFIAKNLKFIPLLIIMMISCLVIMYLYHWMHKHVLIGNQMLGNSSSKSKIKLSLLDSFKMIMQSRYIGLIAMLVLCYGVSTNLIEGVWKSKIQLMYINPEEYTLFMGKFQGYQGFFAIMFMLVGSNIIRKVSWKFAAMLPPLMMLLTGIMFFSFIFFDSTISMYLVGLFSSGSVGLAVMIGTIQQVFAKSTKYSLFDSTKNMAYIPLDKELRMRGQAAVEVVGGRFGKSGGGIIQSSFFMLFPSLNFITATPYFASIFFIIIVIWMYSVHLLDKEYRKIAK